MADSVKTIVLQGSDPEGQALKYTILSQPSHGTVKLGAVVSGGRKAIYTPDANYSNTPATPDSFTFKVNDGVRNSAAAAVSIRVKGAAVVQPTPTGKLNDTGITKCANATTNGLACPQGGFAGQDAENGRDANQATNNDADGHRGFNFTKISSTGAALPSSATAWSCVKDNVTGLIWEVKTDDGGLHDKDWTYTWYEPDNSKNGGNAGTKNGGVCGSTSICDTSSYVKAVKAAGGWCGANGWRMPTVDELSGIARLDRYQSPATDAPAIDTNYFPNTTSTVAKFGKLAAFWSASPLVNSDDGVWSVFFDNGNGQMMYKNNAFQVRLVRSGK